MIKVENGCISVSGNKAQLLSELIRLVDSLYNNNVMTKVELETMVEVALMSGEELKAHADCVKKKCIDKFGSDFVKEMEEKIDSLARDIFTGEKEKKG